MNFLRKLFGKLSISVVIMVTALTLAFTTSVKIVIDMIGPLAMSNLSTFFIVIITFSGTGIALFWYLKGDLTVSDKSELNLYKARVNETALAVASANIEVMQAELKAVRKDLFAMREASSSSTSLTVQEKAKLQADLKKELESAVTDDLLKHIEQKYSAKVSNDIQVTQIRKGLDFTSLRLRQEISALSRRSNVNLLIGILTTAVAVALLVYLVWGSTNGFANLFDLLSHFIPRVSVGVFIEVFSFFFLKLYKSNLEEIKYFQNELTNIEMKGLALESAFIKAPGNPTEPIVAQLMRTDRNASIGASELTLNKVGKPLEPKDIAELLDKLTKLLSLGSGH